MTKIFDLYKNNNVAFFLPGVAENRGGMYQYGVSWINQFRDLPSDLFLAASKNISFKEEMKTVFHLNSTYIKTFAYIVSILSYKFFGFTLFSFRFRHLKIFINSYDINIIHILSNPIYSDLLIRKLLKLSKVKIIYTFHDPVPHNEKKNVLTSYLKKASYRKLYAYAQKYDSFYLHVHSEKLIPHNYRNPGLNIIVEQHPLPPTLVKREKPYLPLCGETIEISLFGRIEPYKGLDNLYNAMCNIARKYPHLISRISILLVGRGQLNHSLWKDLPFSVTIHNEFVSDTFFHQSLANTDLLVLPYNEATQSGVVALAMSYGIPIISTRVGAIPELLENYSKSKLVELSDIQFLHEEIIKMIDKK